MADQTENDTELKTEQTLQPVEEKVPEVEPDSIVKDIEVKHVKREEKKAKKEKKPRSEAQKANDERLRKKTLERNKKLQDLEKQSKEKDPPKPKVHYRYEPPQEEGYGVGQFLAVGLLLATVFML